MAGKVTFDASFTAETGAAEANVKRYADQIKQANATLAQAEKTAKQSYGEQMAQARAVGASTETLSRLTQEYNAKLYAIGMTAKQVGQNLVEANRGAVSSENAKAQAIDLTTKELQAQIVVVNELAAANAHQSHEAISGVQATSAAIRGIEGSGGIRAIENFVSKTLGLGPAMQAIFPLIGAAMFGKMLIDVGVHIYEVEEKAAHAAEATRAAFDEMHTKAQIQIDDLTVTADKLQDNIDKVSGHPGNGLQTALDEARRYADKLMESLKGDNKELQALFKENNVGTFASALSGVASTGKQEQQLLADRVGLTQQFAAINADYNRELANAKSTDAIKVAGDKRDAAVRSSVQRTIDIYKTEGNRLRKEQTDSEAIAQQDSSGGTVAKNNDKKLANITGDTGQLQDFLNQQAAQKRVADLTEQDGAAKLAKEQAEAAKRGNSAAMSAARKAAEEQRKAAEEQRKQWDEQHAEYLSAGDRSAQDEVDFWVARENAATVGSINFLEANKKVDEQLKRVNTERRKAFDESLKMAQQFEAMGHKQLGSVLSASISTDNKGTTDQQNSLKALTDAQRESTYQQALAQAQIDASTGVTSRYDEAVRIQTLHTQEYAAQLAELRAQLAAVDGEDNESIAKRNGLNKQITDANSKAQIESMKDTASVAAGTWHGALSNANAEWVQNSADSAKQVAELYQSVLSGLNNSISSLMTGGKGNFGTVFAGIGKQVSTMGLQHIEGSVLGKLGLGKADGSKSNPLYVKNADAVAGAPSSLMPTSGNGGAAGGFLKSALSFLPGGSMLGGLFGGFRADGGSVSAGKTYMVGERGPELATFGSNAHITPNHRMSDAFGDGGNHAYYSISMGEGVTSEQMHQQMTDLLKQFHPKVIRDSVSAMNERMSRRPASSR